MPRITPGNRLYIYQLLSREIGTGKQTLLSKVEEVFAADDLLPEDLGCASVQEVLEQLDDMVKLTVFKKGNTYATLLQNEEWDRALQQPDEPSAAKKAASKGKPWKHRTKAKVVRPTKPRHRKAQPTPSEGEERPGETGGPESSAPATEASPADLPEEVVVAPADVPEEVSGDAPQAAPEREVQAVPEPVAEPSAAVAPEPTPEPEPERPEPPAKPRHEPSIRLTVTYDPTEPPSQEEQAQEEESDAGDATEGQQVLLVSPAEERPVTIEPLLVGLPDDFASQVHVPDGPLSVLYQLTPPDENPMGILAEDWETARSTRSYGGTRSLVTYPLRLSHEDGTPVRATLRRSAKAVAGKHWSLASIDGLDGNDAADMGVGLEGLPESGTPADRLLAREVEVGPWSESLQALAGVAAPEPWDLPGKAGGLDILRAYLAATYQAVRREGLIATGSEGDSAAFDTGLLSPLSEPVYACLVAGTGDFPWRLLGFSTTGEGALGEHLASLDALPRPPHYLSDLAGIDLGADPAPAVSRRILRDIGEGAEEAVMAAFRRCARDWRLAAPAVDVETAAACLLVPLCTRDAGVPDLALALQQGPDGMTRATRLLGLADAYLEARIVSRGMPSWLEPPAAG